MSFILSCTPDLSCFQSSLLSSVLVLFSQMTMHVLHGSRLKDPQVIWKSVHDHAHLTADHIWTLRYAYEYACCETV